MALNGGDRLGQNASGIMPTLATPYTDAEKRWWRLSRVRSATSMQNLHDF